MDDPSLTADELSWLRNYAQDKQDLQAPMPILARLEKLGLLMAGWNHMHVVTQRGLDLLERLDDRRA